MNFLYFSVWLPVTSWRITARREPDAEVCAALHVVWTALSINKGAEGGAPGTCAGMSSELGLKCDIQENVLWIVFT